MPIIGLTDRPAAFPQIGQLRKGSERPEKGGYGRDLKYFRFTSSDARALEMFEHAYGAGPSSVDVYLPYPTAAQNFQAWREEWKAGGLMHRCDGVTCVLWRRSDGSYAREPKPCPGGCKQVGRLMVILPALERFAYVTVLTSSVHDIIELNENLLAMEALRGSLVGVPMVLSRKPKMISVPDEKSGNRRRMEKWLLSIEAKPEWVALQLLAMERQALGQLPKESRPALIDTRHGTVDAETGEIFDEPEPEEPEDGASEPTATMPEAMPEDAITIRQREREEHARKMAELSQARKALRADGGVPRSMTEDEAAEMTIADLQREIDATRKLLQPSKEQQHAA